MGLSLEFYAGNREQIINAVQECDLDLLDEPGVTAGFADFSLHVEPRDLDLLSRAIGVVENRNALELGNFLNGVVDEDGYGALEVGRDWVRYVATTESLNIDAIVRGWSQSMSALHGASIAPNDSMRRALSDLVSLCRLAVKTDAAVVHIWYR